ncbi:MAG: NfeD family protein [Victivallaceae bacterium]|nr:NfeD family protein [Victivallaceae bacterium]
MDIERFWFWLIAGIVMIVMEALTPGFVVLFFGVGALLTGGVLYFFPHLPADITLLCFIVSSLLFLGVCRRFFAGVFNGTGFNRPRDIENDEVTGAEADVVSAIVGGRPGKVAFRGTDWIASAECDIQVGERVRILRRENLTLFVEPAKSREN